MRDEWVVRETRETSGSSGGHERRFSRDPLQVFSAGGHCQQFWPGQGCLHVVPVTVSSTFQGALKNDFVAGGRGEEGEL